MNDDIETRAMLAVLLVLLTALAAIIFL